MSRSPRMTRINEEIRKELSELINQELKDPRVNDRMISIVRVDTTNDLKAAKVFVSVMGNQKQKDEAMEGLKKASGFLRREIARRINLRNTPEILFKLDDSIEYGVRLSKIIDDVNKKAGDDLF